MIIYPAIDLINGKAVRLTGGDYAHKTEYADDPAAVAQQFAAEGAQYIHVVDLDGAKAKQPVNLKAIEAITAAVTIPVQVGGGIRSLAAAHQLLQHAERVIIGTVAISEPELLQAILAAHGPDKIIVSVDYKDGQPALNGWLESSTISTNDLQTRLKTIGIKTVIVTDTTKDGLLSGPNLPLMQAWKAAGFTVICAGGVTTPADVAALAAAGIDGAIIGKALYEQKITLAKALEAAQ